MTQALGRRLLAVVLIAVVLVPACGRTFRPPAAVVHGNEITDDEISRSTPQFRFLTSLNRQPCGQPRGGESQAAACSRFVLGQLIEGELVGSFARSHDLAVTRTQILNEIIPLEQQFGGHAQLVAQLKQQGLTFSDLRELASRLLLVQKVARAVAAGRLTNRELRAAYRSDRLQFTEIHAAHILVRSRALAARIAAQATPQNFAQLAQRYSTDTGSNFRGGDLGLTPAAGLDRTFALAALSLRPGQVSGPVQTQFGWHVIRLISVRVLPFTSARGRLVRALAGPVFTRWIRRAAGRDVDVNPRYGAFDPSSGQVLAIRCTAATPSPSCKA